jgi:hypothetical protein
MTQEVLPGGYWLRPVLFDEFIPTSRPSVARPNLEVPANEPPEFPLSAPGEWPQPAPEEEPAAPLEMPAPVRGRRVLAA